MTDDNAEHTSSDADYFVVSTMFLHHYATYADAKDAIRVLKQAWGAGNKRQRQRAHALRIYRCHSFGRPCREKPHDGSGFLHVPIEPTDEMLEAGCITMLGEYGNDRLLREEAMEVWRAMIDARPLPNRSLEAHGDNEGKDNG